MEDVEKEKAKAFLRSLIRKQAMDDKEDYANAVLALNSVRPFRHTDPEVATILAEMDETFPTLGDLD